MNINAAASQYINKGWENGVEPLWNCSMCEIFILLRNGILPVKIGSNRLNVQNFTQNVPAANKSVVIQL